MRDNPGVPSLMVEGATLGGSWCASASNGLAITGHQPLGTGFLTPPRVPLQPDPPRGNEKSSPVRPGRKMHLSPL